MPRAVKLFSLIILILCLSGCASKIITTILPDEKSSSKATAIVRTAQSQIGAPYRGGGTTPKGFDCSGLIWWTYRQHGYNVPRKTSDQAKAGKKVSNNRYQAGDILVFNTSRGPNGLHTALYTGEGYFVHSPSSGKKVKQDHIKNTYWSKRLIVVRRILN